MTEDLLGALLRQTDVGCGRAHVVGMALNFNAEFRMALKVARKALEGALVLGTEGDGLSQEALESADCVVSIPMRGDVDSLNVAAASAVAMWALR